MRFDLFQDHFSSSLGEAGIPLVSVSIRRSLAAACQAAF
jgi:hypothetical protein